MMKVFISSTFLDLKDYRALLSKAVMDAGMKPLLIENLSAGENIKDAIVEEINQADIFIIIIGFRLGVLQNSKTTWLEYEYQVALEKQKPILAFMLSDETLIKQSEIDRDQNLVAKFRQKILDNYYVSIVSSANELYMKAMSSLFLIKNRERIKDTINATEEKSNENKNILNKNVRVLKLLLSSPGDVTKERDMVSNAISRFNQEFLIEKGIFIKLIRWEDMAPQIGGGPQNVINKQIDAFDIFLGIMWNRFGTPTDLASSGTEEEFNDALASWEKSNRPWIAFYFSDRLSVLSKDQLKQRMKVLKFKDKLIKKGVLKSYDKLSDFENMVYSDLIKISQLYLKS